MKQSFFFLGLLITISILACKKGFLDVKDNSFLNRQSYVKDLNSMRDFMNGIYFMIAAPDGYEDAYLVAYPDLIADNLKLATEGSPLGAQYNWSQKAGTTLQEASRTMNYNWKALYGIIRACNFVIEDVDKYKAENAEKADNMKGQAYAIRALVHFKLVNIFAQTYVFTADASHAGIPYITTSDITKPYSRQSVAEVYDHLIEDLKNAIVLMPTNTSDCRYMNAMAAKALLAKVYLYKADYSNAKSLAIEIIEKVPLLTVNAGYPDDLFKNKASSQTEVLFQSTPGPDRLTFLGAVLTRSTFFEATNDLGSMLKESSTDVRNKWITIRSNGQLLVTKFPKGIAGGLSLFPETDYYPSVLRASESYLIAAEASAKIGDENAARTYLNVIRKRADPGIADVTASGQELIDLIYKETRKEMCFEGSRMFDLQRWKLGVHRIDVFPGYQKDLPYPSDKAISPIPGADVNLMGISQNAGY